MQRIPCLIGAAALVLGANVAVGTVRSTVPESAAVGVSSLLPADDGNDPDGSAEPAAETPDLTLYEDEQADEPANVSGAF